MIKDWRLNKINISVILFKLCRHSTKMKEKEYLRTWSSERVRRNWRMPKKSGVVWDYKSTSSFLHVFLNSSCYILCLLPRKCCANMCHHRAAITEFVHVVFISLIRWSTCWKDSQQIVPKTITERNFFKRGVTKLISRRKMVNPT